MHYISKYTSPIGKITIAADTTGLIGVWFDDAKYYCDSLDKNYTNKETEIIKLAKKWLNIYFSGKEPDFTPPLNPIGSEFRYKVWEHLKNIPYGKIITYNDIAKEIAKEKGIKSMSAQAVGGAVGHNRISIIIPCHRVVGTNKNLTGYTGGIDKKIKLLKLEGINLKYFTTP